MNNQNPVVLIYKRTHIGDPDQEGIFGINECMGRVRSWEYDAVIGVGGKKPWQGSEQIACKINYIGLGVKKYSANPKDGWPYVTFEKFCLYNEKDLFVKDIAPKLYEYMYEDANVRLVKSDSLPPDIYCEVRKILKLVENAPPSSNYEEVMQGLNVDENTLPLKVTKGCCE